MFSFKRIHITQTQHNIILKDAPKLEGQFDQRAPFILPCHYRHITSESSALLYTIIRHQWGCIRCTRESIVGRSSSYDWLLFVVTYVHVYLYVITVDYRRLPLLPWLPYRIQLLILGNKTFTQSTLPLLPGNYQVITQITRSSMGRG